MYRQIKKFESGVNVSVDTFNYVHAAGRIVYDSIHGSNAGLQIFRFAYGAGTVEWDQRMYNTMHYTDRFHLTGEPFRYTSQLDTTVRQYPDGTVYRRNDMQVRYLPGLNPFFRINAATPWLITPGGELMVDHSSAPMYLIDMRTTVINTWGTWGTDFFNGVASYDYRYRADGYPVRISETHLTSRGASARVLVLAYY